MLLEKFRSRREKWGFYRVWMFWGIREQRKSSAFVDQCKDLWRYRGGSRIVYEGGGWFDLIKSRYLFYHYENTPIQIYWEFYHQKKKTFRWKILVVSYFCSKHGFCRRGGSNEYSQSMFLSRNKKINVYPCKPQLFLYIVWGLIRGSKLYRRGFVMVFRKTSLSKYFLIRIYSVCHSSSITIIHSPGFTSSKLIDEEKYKLKSKPSRHITLNSNTPARVVPYLSLHF